MNCNQTDATILDDLRDMANLLRIHCIEMTEKAESGFELLKFIFLKNFLLFF
jgi:hypothetical protein